MKFDLTKKETSYSITLYLQGELDLSTASELQVAIDNEIHRTDKELLLNLGGLTYMDSTGLGIMISMLKIRQQMGAVVKIQVIPPKIQRLFDLTGVSKFLSVS